MNPPTRPSPAPPWSRGWLFIFAVLALGYAGFIAWYHAPYAGGSDSSGYLNSARLLLEGHLTTPVRRPAGMPRDLLPTEALTPLGFSADATGDTLLPSYPVGLPLHFAAVGWLTGLGPATTVVAISAALALIGLLYLTSREFGVTSGSSAAVAILGALSPLTVQYALQPMSDLVATVWALAAIYGALRAGRQTGWAAASGAAFALAVLVRPSNLLLIVPLALLLPVRRRPWLAFLLGGVPAAIFLAIYNFQLYGRMLTTGYGDVSSLFSAGYLPRTFLHYAQWIPIIATPLVLAGVLLPWCPLERRRKIALAAWAGILLVFYGAYDPTYETWWYLRFILPSLPALGIAAALVLQRWNALAWSLDFRLLPANATPAQLQQSRAWRLPATALLLACGVAWSCGWSQRLRATSVELDERSYPLTGRWAAEHLPADAVLVAGQLSGAVYFYSDRAIVKPNFFRTGDDQRLMTWLAAEKRVLYAALYPDEEAAAQERLPGRWEVVTHLRRTTIWRRLP